MCSKWYRAKYWTMHLHAITIFKPTFFTKYTLFLIRTIIGWLLLLMLKIHFSKLAFFVVMEIFSIYFTNSYEKCVFLLLLELYNHVNWAKEKKNDNKQSIAWERIAEKLKSLLVLILFLSYLLAKIRTQVVLRFKGA